MCARVGCVGTRVWGGGDMVRPWWCTRGTGPGWSLSGESLQNWLWEGPLVENHCRTGCGKVP